MFIALDVSLAWVESLVPIAAAIRKHNRKLAVQLDDSSSSVPLNLAEGSKRRGGDQLYHYGIAAGSLFEARTTVRVG